MLKQSYHFKGKEEKIVSNFKFQVPGFKFQIHGWERSIERLKDGGTEGLKVKTFIKFVSSCNSFKFV